MPKFTYTALDASGKETTGTLYGGTVNNTLDSQVISAVVIPLGSNQTGLNYNFGELLPSSLGGLVFLESAQCYDSSREQQ